MGPSMEAFAMAARSTWKGYLKLNLVSVPVKAYTATASGGEVKLNQLHAGCNSRINYKKTCPIHGEVSNDQIVSGFEYAKGQYVVVDPEEVDKLRSEDDKAVKIDAFVAPEEIDPIYFNGKAHYLVPDGPVGQGSFAVIHEGMVQEKKYAVARVVMHGKEQVVVLRPLGNLIAMMSLDYDSQVTKHTQFEGEVPKMTVAPEELKLVKTLIEAVTPKEFDLASYKDLYTERLTQLIDAKVAGKEIVAPPAAEHPQVINLMEALKASVAQLQKPGEAKEPEAAEAGRPPKKVAASTRGKEAKVPKRKTS
jgi:DNA end-binding protein Ku